MNNQRSNFGSSTAAGRKRGVRWVAHVLGVIAGLGFGYDIGLRMSGVLMGLVMAANAAFFCAMAVSAVADQMFAKFERLRGARDKRKGADPQA